MPSGSRNCPLFTHWARSLRGSRYIGNLYWPQSRFLGTDEEWLPHHKWSILVYPLSIHEKTLLRNVSSSSAIVNALIPEREVLLVTSTYQPTMGESCVWNIIALRSGLFNARTPSLHFFKCTFLSCLAKKEEDLFFSSSSIMRENREIPCVESITETSSILRQPWKEFAESKAIRARKERGKKCRGVKCQRLNAH